jgi:preprotein translocase subunit SecD
MRTNMVVWKICSVIFFVWLAFVAVVLLAVIAAAWPPTLGAELSGRVQMIYEVDRTVLANSLGREPPPESVPWPALTEAIGRRINPGQGKDVVVRRAGDWRIEVIVPELNSLETHRIEELIGTAGALEFRVVANSRDHEDVIQMAEEQSRDPEKRQARYVTKGKRNVGFWARVPRDRKVDEGIHPLKVSIAGYTLRDASTGDLIRLPPTFDYRDTHGLEKYLAEQKIAEIEVLLYYDDGFDVTGAHLRTVTLGRDQLLRPCVHFDMNAAGAARMGGLTGTSQPTGDFYRLLGIVLDGQHLSAPRVMSTISDRGQITGNFTVEEVEFLVAILHAGSLPVPLRKPPVSMASLAPNQAARRAMMVTVWTTLGGLAMIWLALLLRYRWMGLGGCLTSLLHGLVLLMVIELLRVPVTQGLAMASSVTLLGIAAGTALVCEPVRRRLLAGKDVWPGLLRNIMPLGLALVLAFLALLLVVAYLLGEFPARNAAVAVVIGSVAGGATCCVVLPLLIALLAAGWRHQSGDGAVLDAEVLSS